MPAARACSWKVHAPNRLPWSVRASESIPSALVRLIRSGIRLAPSRSEYSEWVWRCTKGMLRARYRMGQPLDNAARESRRLGIVKLCLGVFLAFAAPLAAQNGTSAGALLEV